MLKETAPNGAAVVEHISCHQFRGPLLLFLAGGPSYESTQLNVKPQLLWWALCWLRSTAPLQTYLGLLSPPKHLDQRLLLAFTLWNRFGDPAANYLGYRLQPTSL